MTDEIDPKTILPENVQREAFRVGYRLGIGAGKYIEWVHARDANRPENVRIGAWKEAFDKIADAAMEVAHKRLDRAIAQLDGQTELAADAFFNPSQYCTFTSYPPYEPNFEG